MHLVQQIQVYLSPFVRFLNSKALEPKRILLYLQSIMASDPYTKLKGVSLVVDYGVVL